MKKTTRKNLGMKKLVQKYKDKFRIPENLNHYAEEDFKSAERKYLKYVFMEGEIYSGKSRISHKLKK